MALAVILIAAALAALSGVPGLLADRRASWGQWLATALMGASALAGLAGVAMCLSAGSSVVLFWPPSPAPASTVILGLDALGAFFLAPLFLIGGLGSVYGQAYWRQAEHVANGRKLRLFWGLLVAGIVILMLARHGIVFLFGWETMAVACFFLVSTEDHQAEARASGWLYLVSTHIGTLCLFALFALLRRAGGSFALQPIAADQAGLGLLTAIFFLALAGFGLKAGLMPLHFWLPSSHANAPSHVSALMSGVLIKTGIYGLVRVTGLLPDPPVAWGALLLLLGAVSGVLGVVLALGQHDLKRLLAYHSIENIGIIVMGLGLAMVGRSLGRADWVLLGLAGCLLHVWNHGLFKALLFLGAGSVVHATHTREIDRLGGLARVMPWTAALFLTGAVAICGLPPLNGFVSEWLLYVGFLRGATTGHGAAGAGAAAAAPVLALIGALALACFVKAYGAVFLGASRSRATLGAHESPPAMLLPMGILAGACALIGLVPRAVAPLLERAVAAWLPATAPAFTGGLAVLAPLAWIGILGALLLATAGGGWALLVWLRPLARVPRTVTWDCGYARPTARMQYTASSFADTLTGLFRWVLRPREHRPVLRAPFAVAAHFESHVDDPVLDRELLPAARVARRELSRFRGLQQGLTQNYVLYILIAVVLLLIWTLPLGELLARLFSR